MAVGETGDIQLSRTGTGVQAHAPGMDEAMETAFSALLRPNATDAEIERQMTHIKDLIENAPSQAVREARIRTFEQMAQQHPLSERAIHYAHKIKLAVKIGSSVGHGIEAAEVAARARVASAAKAAATSAGEVVAPLVQTAPSATKSV